MISFLLGNGLMIVAGAWCAIVYQQADIVEVMMLQGLSFAAVVMLCLNLWTIQGPTIYNVSAAACHLLRSERRRSMTLAALASVQLPRYNLNGLVAYAVGALLAYSSPWIAPLVGIAASAFCYIGLIELRGRGRALHPMQGDQ